MKNIERAQEVARANIQRAQHRMKENSDQNARCPTYQVGQKVWVYTPVVPKGLSKKLKHHWHGPYRIVEKLSPVHFVLRTTDNRRLAAVIHINRMKHFYDPDDRPVSEPADIDPSDEPCLCSDEFYGDSFETPAETGIRETLDAETTTDTPPAVDDQNVPVPDEDVQDDTNPMSEFRLDLPRPGNPIRLVDDEPIYKATKLLARRKYRRKTQYLVQWEGCPENEATWEPEDNILDPTLLANFNNLGKAPRTF